MFCTACGTQLPGSANYCPDCGHATAGAPPRGWQARTQKLSRPREGKKIAGVCAGIARYFDLDPSLVRIVWVVLTLCPPFPGIIAYVVCWIVMPLDPWLLPSAAQNTSATPAGSRPY